MALTQVKSDGIADGAVTTNDLSDSGVTAGTYGSSSAIPAITVDAKGRVTSASTNSVTQVGGANGVDFNDSVKARFGSANDLEIYHDGSNSYVHDIGTGELRLNSGNAVRIRKHDNETMALFTADGAVELYHDNSAKLATTSTGIDVTGSVTCDGLTSDQGTLRVNMQSGAGLVLVDSNSTGDAATTYIEGNNSALTQMWYLGDVNASGNVYLSNSQNGSLVLRTNNIDRVSISSSGSFEPGSNNQYDIGASNNQWRNAYFDGTVYTDEIVCDGPALIAAGTGELRLRDNDDSGNNTSVFSTSVLRGQDSAGTNKWWIGDTSSGNTYLEVWNAQNGPVVFGTNNTNRAYFHGSDGHFLPWTNNTYDLGSTSNRWRNVYTNDLNLSNEGGTNDVDGTWGSWTIQEGEDDLFLLNRRNGKKYKFNLTEVN